mgnify:CR=1 FL=1
MMDDRYTGAYEMVENKPTFDFTEMSRNIDKIAGKGGPPVDKWNPDMCGDIDMRILRDGTWLYEGTPIGRQAMVTLFASVLWKEGNDYFLKTPVEKVGIKVDDVPFHFIHVEKVAHERGEALCFISRTGDRVIASQEHPIRVETDPVTGEPSPYLYVRFGMEGLISRAVFYDLVEQSHEEMIDGVAHLVINSAGETIVLGRSD